ncbi:MAG TPA: SpoIID/LytB domain-containing protein [Planktothrix sp.]|jgi:stage II sporulation protein D
MQLLVGLTTSDLSSLRHKSVQISSAANIFAQFVPADKPTAPSTAAKFSPGNPCVISAAGNELHLPNGQRSTLAVELSSRSPFQVDSLKRNGKRPEYRGNLLVFPDGDRVRIVLLTDLETYIEGVLQSEIPATYELEAIKAQAVTARTYGLHPRINHADDLCNVCDSYLCCQYFAGRDAISPKQKQAIAETKGQIVTYESKPILALFSSSAGGHTEDYDNCFSDPITGAFPPPPLPYLKGVAEGELPAGYTADGVTEVAMRELFNEASPQTYDGWASQFKWSVSISADLLESHIHHTVETMLAQKEQAAFITPPASKTFGHIKSFKVERRGVAGTAIELSVETSTGAWKFEKELVIRSIFKIPELKLARLRSGRILFDHHYGNLGFLSSLQVRGLGFGHGVGLQQTGAEGMARKGKTYKEITAHYFKGTEISTV